MNTSATQKYKSLKEFKNHEQIIALNDKASGLRGFIAIHSTALGPALGGTRIFPYKSRRHALKDVLRLSWAMTNKCAIAGLKFGGGKGVIIANPGQKNIRRILKAYAQKVSELNGKFHTGEDVGLSEADVQYMLNFCPFFIGKSRLAGDPSPHAGLSAFLCAEVALKYKLGSGVKDKTFAIKGLGKTGSELARLAYKAGANVIVADLDQKKITAFKKKFPKTKSVPVSKIQKQICDVYAPCAMGDDINFKVSKTIPAKIICGTANNQLVSPQEAEILFKRGVLWVPDYLANAGGLINVSSELWPGGHVKAQVLATINRLKNTLIQILKTSDQTKKNPGIVAGLLVQKFIKRHSSK